VADLQRSAVAVACIIALTSLAATACGRSAGVACSRNPSATSIGLCIDDVRATVTAGSKINLRAHVSNDSGRALSGKLWWVVAPLGSGAPWDRAIFLSSVDQRTYATGSKVSLTWANALALPTAFYDIAVIAHRVNSDSSETHSDAVFIAPIHFEAPAREPWLIRREGAGPAVVASASNAQLGPDGLNPFSRTVSIANQSSTPIDFSVHIDARVLLVGWEDRWWASPTVYSAPAVDGHLIAGQATTLRLESAAPARLLASFPDAQFWIVLVVGKQPADQALLGGASTFDQSVTTTLMRRGAPSGPVELVGISTALQWSHSVRGSVSLSLSNLTGANQVIQGWWYLATAGDPKPWSDSRAGGVLGRITLGPWATRSVPVGADAPGAAGHWELSAWVHAADSTGAFTQTDALWLASPVAIV
jgi:hypothetical protein